MRWTRRTWACGVVAALLLALGAFSVGAGAASATSSPVITVPSQVGYYASVDVQGTEAPASSIVTVEFQHIGSTAWTEHNVRTDGVGNFELSFPLTADTQVRAVAGAVSSAIHTVKIVQASCSTSGPVFTTFPIKPGFPTGTFSDFVGFSATRSGVWAGVADSAANANIAVITWRAGQQPRVLDEFNYRKAGSMNVSQPGSVNVLAVGAQGQVLVSAQDPSTPYSFPGIRFHGYLYGGVHRTTLAASPNWISVQPTGMSDDGTIVGVVNYIVAKKQRSAVVAWTAGGTHVHVVHDDAFDPAIDRTGDITYIADEQYGVVVTPSGAAKTLPSGEFTDGSDAEATIDGSTHAVYGEGEFGPTRWTVNADASTQPVNVSTGGDTLYAVGPNGEMVFGERYTLTSPVQRFVTATGALVPLANELHDDLTDAGVAINSSGTIAYTEADHHVHLMTCH